MANSRGGGGKWEYFTGTVLVGSRTRAEPEPCSGPVWGREYPCPRTPGKNKGPETFMISKSLMGICLHRRPSDVILRASIATFKGTTQRHITAVLWKPHSFPQE